MGMGLTPTAKRPRTGFSSPPGSCGSGFMSPPTARKPGVLSQQHRVLPLGSLQDTYAACCRQVRCSLMKICGQILIRRRRALHPLVL